MQWHEVKISKKDVLQYLGSKISDEVIDKQIEAMTKLVKQDAKYSICYKVVDKKEEYLQNKILLGKDINNLLATCDEVILMAASLGMQVDKRLKQLQKQDISLYYVYHACANALIEALCDDFHDTLIQEYALKNRYVGDRFSCGYGDLPIHIQNDLINYLQATKQIGIYVSEEHLMIPSKSVSAIIGISNQLQAMKIRGCNHCMMKDKCMLKAGGKRCGS